MPEQVLSAEQQPAEKPFPWRCPKCRQATVNRVTMPYRCQRKYNGRQVTVEVPNLIVPRCSNCSELVFDYSADEQIRAAFRSQFGPEDTAMSRGEKQRSEYAGTLEEQVRQHTMSIFKAEEQLFAKWLVRRTDLVRDGVADEQAYLQSDPKVLFVLKEVNAPKGGWDLREFMRRGGRDQTWNPIARWITAIRRLPEKTCWQDVATIDKARRTQALQSIAAMNLKKSPGGASTQYQSLAAAARADADLLTEQFLLYDADVVICCGNSVAMLVDEAFHLDGASVWKNTTRGVLYKEHKKGKFIISYAHPQVRIWQNLLLYGIVDAIAELRTRTMASEPLQSTGAA